MPSSMVTSQLKADEADLQKKYKTCLKQQQQ